jgi:peptidoglycan/LPS O-acetylase OafA/YrhL
MVLYCHSLAPMPELDPRYSPSSLFWRFETGQGAVLLFFVISGYVIGLTNAVPFSPGRARQYLRRRAVRLLPLYWIAIALSVLSRPRDSAGAIVDNLLFLQNGLPYLHWHASVLISNSNLWSLNYEVVYYLAFLVVWRLEWRPGVVAAVCGLASTLGFFLPAVPGFLTCYAGGGVFWFAGLWLARRPQSAPVDRAREPWPALLLLYLATWKLKPTFLLLHRLNVPIPDHWVGLIYFDFLPVCVALLAIASGRRFRGWRAAKWLCLALPVGYFAWRASRGMLLTDPDFHATLALTVAAAALWWWKPAMVGIGSMAAVGSISYAIYIFQRPVQWFVRDWLPLPAGSSSSFGLRMVVFLGLTFAVAYLMEHVLQPRISRVFKKSP